MKDLNSLVAELRQQLTERQAVEAVDIEKSTADLLNDSITAYLNQKKAMPEATEEQPATPEAEIAEGRKVKSKGIALTAAAQGGPANGRPVSLLMKTAAQPTIIRRQLILKSAAAGATLIRKSDGALCSENGMQITNRMHELMDRLGIEYTIRDEG